MNALRLMVAGSILLSLAACADRVAKPQDESILEVIDRADAAPPPQAKLTCNGNEVTYCELDNGTRHCSCQDSAEVNRWLGRLYSR